MNKTKKILALAVSLIVTGTVFAGCGSQQTAAPAASTNSTQKQDTKSIGDIAIILKTLSNPFWASMKEGIEAEAKAKGVKVDVFAVNSEDDTQGQLQVFEDVLSKNYKAIGIAPLSPVNVVPTIAKANQKGIYVVNIDEKVDMQQLKSAGGSVLSFVTTDNEKVGEKAAKFIVDKLGSAGGNVAIVEGKAGNASGEDRKNGAKKMFESTSGIKIVASQPADWDRSKALDVATNMLQRNPDIKAFYCCNDTMALGVLQAVQNSGKNILVVGTDGDPEAVKDIQAGKMSATVAQDPAKIGATSLDLLIKALQDKPQISADKDPDFIPVDSNLVTK
jgi:D-allose transport system substrate-binding protein